MDTPYFSKTPTPLQIICFNCMLRHEGEITLPARGVIVGYHVEAETKQNTEFFNRA